MNERPNRARAAVSVDLRTRLALRPAEAAATLGLSERAFREIAHQLPNVRFGRSPRFPVEGLRRWLEEHARAEADRSRQLAEDLVGRVLQGRDRGGVGSDER